MGGKNKDELQNKRKRTEGRENEQNRPEFFENTEEPGFLCLSPFHRGLAAGQAERVAKTGVSGPQPSRPEVVVPSDLHSELPGLGGSPV